MMDRKCVLISDYGRSGQGWLSYMLCYLLNARYIEPYDFMKGQIYTKNEAVLKLTRGGLPGRAETPYYLVIKTHELPPHEIDLTDKVIFLTRDPRDVAVSAFFRYRQLAIKDPSSLAGLNWKDRLKTRFRLLSHASTARAWARHYRLWENRPAQRVRYEDLSRDPAGELRKLLAYLEVSAPDSLVQEAVDAFTFERMSGRKRGHEDETSKAFRKGVVGDHANHFSPLETRVFRALCGEEMRRAGYDL